MRKQTEQTKVVLEALANFPNTSKKSLGELIYKNNKLLFKDAEDARRAVRYHTSANGKCAPKDLSKQIKHQSPHSRVRITN